MSFPSVRFIETWTININTGLEKVEPCHFSNLKFQRKESHYPATKNGGAMGLSLSNNVEFCDTTLNPLKRPATSAYSIKDSFNAFASSSGSIKDSFNAFASSSGSIKDSFNAFASSSGSIKDSFNAFASSSESIK